MIGERSLDNSTNLVNIVHGGRGLDSITSTQIALLIFTALIASAISIYAAATSKGKGRFLCDDCRFNNDKDCFKSERPKAVSCTSYRESARSDIPESTESEPSLDEQGAQLAKSGN